MSRHSNKYTVLNDRVLFFDGDSIAQSESIVDMMLAGVNVVDAGVYFAENTKETQLFTKQYPDVMGLKRDLKHNEIDWDIPEYYKQLDVKAYIQELLVEELEHMDEHSQRERISRTQLELNLWTQHDMIPLLQTLIYVIATFIENNIVWGTGRGSSCCCYILYLIGVHDVDSVLYELELDEFFR